MGVGKMKIDNNTAHIFLSQFCGLMFQQICTQTFSECKNYNALMKQYNKYHTFIQSLTKKNIQKNLEYLILENNSQIDNDTQSPAPILLFNIPDIKHTGILALYKARCEEALSNEFYYWMDQFAQLN